MYDAIILAGGENNKLSELSSQPFEALVEIAGKPMVTFVARALAASSRVDRIFVIGPEKDLACCDFPDSAIVLEGGRTIMETITIGMDALGHGRKTLVVTADIPLLTSDAVEDFLRQCELQEADLYYPVIAKDTNDRYYPGNKRTYVRLKEGVFTGGNIFLVNPAVVPHCMQVAERLIENRKNPLKLCHILGWSFICKFLLGILRMREVEKRVSELLTLNGAVVVSRYPELGIDVDKPSDLKLVRQTILLRV